MPDTAYEHLSAALPRRERAGRDSFPATSKAVRAWIDALPLANSGATARLLYNGLKELNQLEVDPGQRFEILEQMRHPVAVVITSMERHVLGQPLPLPNQKRQIGAVMRDFHRELAVGYAECVVDICAPRGNVPFLRGKAAAAALLRAITHAAQLLSKCYISYSEVPSATWALLHRLAAFGFDVQLMDKSQSDGQFAGVTLSGETMYIQALLSFIGNPYRLTQKEIVDVEAAARIWAGQVRIDQLGSGGSFVIDPRSDSPPMSPRAEPQSPFWRLDTSQLVLSLKSQMQVRPGIDAPVSVRGRLGHGPDIAADVVDKLITAWSFSGERSHPRLQANHRMEACIGLHAVHYLAAQKLDFKEFAAELSGGVALSDRERSAAWAQTSSESQIPLPARVRVIDQSLGGYRVIWENAEGLKAKVGELVVLAAISDDDDERDWLVGVLRWLKGGSTESLEAGIQLLSRRVEPAAVRATGEANSSRVILRALLLAPLAIEGDQSSTLLVPSIMDAAAGLELLRLQDPLGIEERRVLEPLENLELLENTGAFKQFRFGKHAATPVLGAPEAPPASELDEIWSSV